MNKKAVADSTLALLKLLPSDMRGRMLVDAYLNSDTSKKTKERTEIDTKKVMAQPGTSYALYNYLNGKGKDRVPEIVGHHLGNHWYTGAAKKLSGTTLGRNFVMRKILDKTLPTIDGDNSLAYQFLMAGGRV